ncbi:MAG: hypothetical protein RLZZ367_1836 [Bacteroidota bacterium]|jgi:putative membrane protein
MHIAALLFTGLVAGIHLYIVWMEMFAWETAGKKAFKGAMPDEMFKPTKTLAGNQGLYNGFLVAGLLWSYLITDPEWSQNVALFFLGCVAVAGLYGAVTASRKILFVQTIPAAIAIACWLLG